MKTHKKILIIEDNPDISKALAEVLCDLGHEIYTAFNGKAALDLLINKLCPDVILLDLFLPVMNGLEFRKLQLQIPHLARIPVIAMSADAYVHRRCRAGHISHYLKKPFEYDELLSAIENA